MQAQPAASRFPWNLEERQLIDLFQTLAVFAGSLALILVIRHVLFRVLYHRAGSRVKTVFLDTLRFPSFLWCLAGALAIALRFATLTERQIELAGNWIVVFVIVSLTLVAAAGAVRMIEAYGERQGMHFAVAGLSRTLTYVVVLSTGALVLMRFLGLEITPLLTALGVGGLAVALALQDTLANFFAGVHILVETPISLGDFIQLASGEEGTVTDIGWRTTRVLTGANNTIVIPNTKITSGILTNYFLPDRRVVAEVAILAHHDADLEQIRRIALEEAVNVEGVLASRNPVFLFDPGVTPTHLQSKVLVHVETPQQKGAVQSALRLRILDRFRRDGVPLPSNERIAVMHSEGHAHRG